MDKEHWDAFWKSVEVEGPSEFAKFCAKRFEPGSSIVSLGCGNGRDLFFFKDSGFSVTGVDQVDVLSDKLEESDKVVFRCSNFNELEDIPTKNIYCRFVLHTIPEGIQDQLLSWAYRNLDGGLFCVECRSSRDDSVQAIPHYRRLIDSEKLISKLESMGFGIIYMCEDKGLSVTPTENPVLIRILCKKIVSKLREDKSIS